MNQWYAVSELMDKLGIPADHNDRAFELRSELHHRRWINSGNREEETP